MHDFEERECIINESLNNISFSRAIAKIDLDKLPDSLSIDIINILKINIDKILIHIDDFITHKWQPIELFGLFKQDNKIDGVLIRLPVNAKIKSIDNMFITYSISNDENVDYVLRTFRSESKFIWNF